MKVLHKIAWLLVVIGGLNWLLVGLFSWDVGMIFGGQGAIISKIVYILVGLSAIYLIFGCKKCSCKMGKGSKMEEPPQMPEGEKPQM